MRLFLVLVMLFVSGILSAQNQAINNPINQMENNDQQLIAINNQPKLNNIQINYQANETDFDLPQLSKPQSAGLSVSSSSSSSSSGSSSGVSTKSTHHKTIKMLTSGRVVKHMDKKGSIRHHYKKKSRIKRCASF
jgi:hypothetical protein